jgi:predicted Zn-dependent protease
MLRLIVHLCFLVVILMGAPQTARASGPILIRDAEIETILRQWTTPIAKAAGLAPDSVKIILIQNSDINAFVAGGQNIFIYTGLIDESSNAAEVMGVIAHELGHIAGGHLFRTADQMEKASYEMIVGTLLGLGAAVATGQGDAAAAVISGSSHLAQTGYLSHSRAQESAADQAALRYLTTANLSTAGLVSFMQKLADQELLPPSQQSQYMRTHPISRDRVNALKARIEQTGQKDPIMPAKYDDQHARIKAKLAGFITPLQVDLIYAATDRSIAADYARAVADYRRNNLKAAVDRIDALIAREPNNPYFYELKGQMLFEAGQVKAARIAYQRAVTLSRQHPLINLAYAQTLLSDTASKNDLVTASALLEQAKVKEPRNAQIFRQLGIAYGRLGRAGAGPAMLAEAAFLSGRYQDARTLIAQAERDLPANSPLRQGMRDLSEQLSQVKEKKETR